MKTNPKTSDFLCFISFSLLLLYSCVPLPQSISSLNISPVYSSASGIKPQIVVYHKNDTVSTVFIKLNPSEFAFNQSGTPPTLKARIKVKYLLVNSLEDSRIADSSFMTYQIEYQSMLTPMTVHLSIKARLGNKYQMHMNIMDLNRNMSKHSIISVDKSSYNTSQNYAALLTANNSLIFNNTIKNNDSYFVSKITQRPVQLVVDYFRNESPLAPPPFSTVQPMNYFKNSDSTQTFLYESKPVFSHNARSFLFIKSDSAKNQGLAIFNFGDNFPTPRSADDLLKPLQYLTTSKEYKELQQQLNKKIAVDNFWLMAAPDFKQAKELIRIYYTRVMYANQFFTSYTEGWRTDRGMVFVIFGPPSNVFKNDLTEKWVYEDPVTYKPVNFVFEKKFSPYTDNHYMMQRNLIYQNLWFKAVDSWRSGKAFFLDK